MIKINALGKPCPIPVIEVKKALAEQDGETVLAKVDNFAAVQNLNNLANNYNYGFSYVEISKKLYEVTINRNGKSPLTKSESTASSKTETSGEMVVVIGRNTMGAGAEELGKILIKAFIYSLTELSTSPKYVIFLNSGAYLTSSGANTIDDLKVLEQKGTEILTCGTCINYYEIQDKLAIGTVVDMYSITEKMAAAANIINI